MSVEYKTVTDDPELLQKVQYILELCKDFGISIAHEDYQGGFIIQGWDDANAARLLAAADERPEPEPYKPTVMDRIKPLGR